LKAPIVAALALALSACALPQTTVRTGSSQPSVIVQGAPSDAVLYVDGLSMGLAHQGSTVIFRDRALFSGGETHPIKLLPVAAP
jgi:hypothetical protein